MSKNRMILGVRCSPSEFAFAILDGTQSAPVVVCNEKIAYPKDHPTSARLSWLRQELTDLVKKHDIHRIVVKGIEPFGKLQKTSVERVECEAIVFLVAGENGMREVRRKVKSTIAKDLGLKGKAKYLVNANYDVIAGYEALDNLRQEAILVAWSELNAG